MVMEVVYMDKKIFGIIFFAMILITPMVSAWEFDNVVRYDEVKNEITIKNSVLGIPFLDLDTIAEVKLLSDPVVYVIAGEDRLIGEFEITNYEKDYPNVFKELEFYDLNRGGKEIIKNFTYKYLNREDDIEVPVYEKVCEEIVNINNSVTTQCHQEQTGTEMQEVWEWKNLENAKLDKLPIGKITIGIFIDVKTGERGDWIPTLFGIKIDQWAIWQESMSVGLTHYYNFEEGTGTNAQDNVGGNNNFTLTNANLWNATGKIGSGLTQSGDQSAEQTNWTSGSVLIMNFWTIFTGTPNWEYLVYWGDDIAGKSFNFGQTNVADYWFSSYSTFDLFSPQVNDTWTMITLMTNSSGSFMYVNGTLKISSAVQINMSATNYIYLLGRNNDAQYVNVGISIDELGLWNRSLTQTEISGLYNSGDGITYSRATAPTISLITPSDNYNTTTEIDDFSFNITYNSADWNNYTFNVWNSSDDLIKNIVVVNGTTDADCSVTTGDGTYSQMECIGQSISTDGVYNWNVYGCNDVLMCSWATANYTFTIDGTNPSIVLNGLTNISTINIPVNSTQNITASDTHLGSCWYYTSDNSTNTTATCNTNFNILWATGGLKTITVYANDTLGNINSTSGSFNIYDFNVSQSGSATAGEGSSQTFTLLVNSTSSPIGDSNAELWYNGVNRGVTSKTAVGTNSYYFTKILTIPLGSGNSTGKDVNWLWEYNTNLITTRNTTTQTQKVYNVSVSDCSISGGTTILNLSLRDEELNSLVNITSPNLANIELDLTISSLIDSTIKWSFSKHWRENNTVSICVPNELLNSTSYKIDFTLGFDATDHVREFYYLDNGTLDNTSYFNTYTSNTISLFDLATDDWTTFLFEYTDSDNQKVDDIIVHTFRKYIGEGESREVERSKQDNAGQTHIHLVEEDVIYYFMITQYGKILYTSGEYNAKCLSSPCTISLSSSPTETNWSVIDNEGGKYIISVDKDTRISTTTFNLDEIATINSSIYRFYNGTEEIINSSTLTGTAGSIKIYIPLTYDNSTFFVAIYKNGVFIKSQWISLTESAIDYFGTAGAIFGGLIVVALMMMSISEGIGFIIFTFLSLIIISIMQLIDLSWLAIISIICAGGVIIFKLTGRRGSKQ